MCCNSVYTINTMKYLLVVTLLAAAPSWADTRFVNCGVGMSLQHAIDRAEPGEVIKMAGSCLGPVKIAVSRLTLKGVGGSSINGQNKDAITVQGASNIVLDSLDVSGGANGIVLNGGAAVSILNTNVHDNGVIGILVEGSSSATVSGGSVKHNGLNGLDAETSSSVTITGPYLADSNTVFGININGSSSLLLTQANLTVQNNILGAQIGTSASAFVADSNTTLSFLEQLSRQA